MLDNYEIQAILKALDLAVKQGGLQAAQVYLPIATKLAKLGAPKNEDVNPNQVPASE